MLRTPPADPQVPVLETERLRLRALTLADFPAHCALWADPDVSRYTSGKPSSSEDSWGRMMRHAGQWSMLGFGFWLVEELSTGAFVGEVGLFDNQRALIYPDGTTRALTTPEIGWILSPAMHGRG
jgi:RimJ/RimL family protein N-acetyltransferase